MSYQTTVSKLKKSKIGDIIPGAVECPSNPDSNYSPTIFYASKEYPGMENRFPWPTDKPNSFDAWENAYQSSPKRGTEDPLVDRLRFMVEQLTAQRNEIRFLVDGFRDDYAINPDEEWVQETDPLERQKLTARLSRIERLLTSVSHRLKLERNQKRASFIPKKPAISTFFADEGDE
jgi:hypothetical protein